MHYINTEQTSIKCTIYKITSSPTYKYGNGNDSRPLCDEAFTFMLQLITYNIDELTGWKFPLWHRWRPWKQHKSFFHCVCVRWPHCFQLAFSYLFNFVHSFLLISFVLVTSAPILLSTSDEWRLDASSVVPSSVFCPTIPSLRSIFQNCNLWLPAVQGAPECIYCKLHFITHSHTAAKFTPSSLPACGHVFFFFGVCQWDPTPVLLASSSPDAAPLEKVGWTVNGP